MIPLEQLLANLRDTSAPIGEWGDLRLWCEHLDIDWNEAAEVSYKFAAEQIQAHLNHGETSELAQTVAHFETFLLGMSLGRELERIKRREDNGDEKRL